MATPVGAPFPQHAEGAARSLVELVRVLQDRGIEYPVEAYRVHSHLTRCAGELRTAVEVIEASVQQLQDKGGLMSDSRGEPSHDVLQRFTESSAAAKDLAGALHGRLNTAYSAIGTSLTRTGPRSRNDDGKLSPPVRRVIVCGRCGAKAGAGGPGLPAVRHRSDAAPRPGNPHSGEANNE